jgi:hypothetical protein
LVFENQKDKSIKFIKIQSILMKERNRLNDFESTNGETFEICLNQATQEVKKHMISYKVYQNQQFDARALMKIFS